MSDVKVSVLGLEQLTIHGKIDLDAATSVATLLEIDTHRIKLTTTTPNGVANYRVWYRQHIFNAEFYAIHVDGKRYMLKLTTYHGWSATLGGYFDVEEVKRAKDWL